MRGGLFMGWKAAAVGAGFGVKFRHMIDICFGQTAGIINFGKFCRQLGETSVLQAADVVAGLCGLALGVGAGVAFHGWVLWVELTGLEGQSGNAIVTAIGRNYVNGAEGVDLNDGANLAVDRDGLADGGFRGIHAVFYWLS